MRKIVIGLIVVSLFISSIITCYATNDLNRTKVLVEDVLSSVLLQNKMFNADFNQSDKLFLGPRLNAYRIKDGNIESIHDIDYYPILNQKNRWIATVSICKNSIGQIIATASTSYAEEYNILNAAIKEPCIAIVFDEKRDYIYCSNQQTKPDFEFCYTECILTNPIKQEIALNINSAFKAAGDVVSLGVPQTAQINNNTCWAASITSILNYYGGSYTVSGLCSALGVSTSSFQDIWQSANHVGTLGHDYGTGGNNNQYFHSSLTMTTLVTELYIYSAPIFTAYQATGSYAGHAVVVQGYVNYSGMTQTMQYMDPWTGYYYSTTVPSSGISAITTNGVTRSYGASFAVYD